MESPGPLGASAVITDSIAILGCGWRHPPEGGRCVWVASSASLGSPPGWAVLWTAPTSRGSFCSGQCWEPNGGRTAGWGLGAPAGLLSFPKAAHPPRTLLRQILLDVPRSCPSLGWALCKQQRTVCRVTEGSQTPSPHGGPAPGSGLTSWIPQASLASAARGSGRSLTTQTPRPSSSFVGTGPQPHHPEGSA